MKWLTVLFLIVGFYSMTDSQTMRRRVLATGYLLKDEFSDTLAAGAVNGTAAVPGPGTRTVADASSVMSIGSGVVRWASGTNGQPKIAYAGLTRQAGRMIFSSANFTGIVSGPQYGFSNTQGTVSAWVGDQTYFTSGGGGYRTNEGTHVSYWTPVTLSVFHDIMVVLRSTGSMQFYKPYGTNTWLLGWTAVDGTTTPIYPAIQNYNAAGKASYLRVPTTLWLPTPLASDGFPTSFGTTDGTGHAETSGLGAGGSGLTWTHGGTWSVSGGKAINTPTLQATELLANGGCEGTYVDSVAPDWHKGGSATVTEENTIFLGGIASQKSVTTAINTGIYEYTTAASPYTGGKLGRILGYLYVTTGSARIDGYQGTFSTSATVTATSTWTPVYATGTVKATDGPYAVARTASSTFYIDSVSYKLLNAATLYAAVETGVKDVLAATDLVVTTGTMAGLVVNYSDTLNLVIAYHNGIMARMDLDSAGTWRNLVSATTTYSANATLRVVKDSVSYTLYYNNVKIGSTMTVGNTTVTNATKHGLFSTYSGNTMDNFTVYNRGRDNSYSALNAWSGP